MRGFKHNDLAIELIDHIATNPKAKKGLLLALRCIREKFPNCDIYPAYRLGGGHNRISFGSKKQSGKKASGCAFRIRPIENGEASLRLNGEYALNQELSKAFKRSVRGTSFTLSDLATNQNKLKNFLDTAYGSEKFRNKMAGSKLLPDDYGKKNPQKSKNRGFG